LVVALPLGSCLRQNRGFVAATVAVGGRSNRFLALLEASFVRTAAPRGGGRRLLEASKGTAMMKRIVSVALAFVAGIAVADIPTNKPATGNAPEWMKHTQPGEGHKMLSEMTGRWSYTMKWWATPSAKPDESKGTATGKMILGGRFLQQEVSSKVNGQPFNGMGITGFDSFRNEYQSMWIDSMSTHMMMSSGSYDANTRTLKETGNMTDLMAGMKDRWFRTELNMKDKNAYTYAMYSKDAAGAEFKMMEIEYKKGK
jgi:hypothetical protein